MKKKSKAETIINICEIQINVTKILLDEFQKKSKKHKYLIGEEAKNTKSNKRDEAENPTKE